MITVAYFTKDTPYEREAEQLAGTLRKFGMHFEMASIESTGWQSATRFKANYLHDVCGRHPRDRVLYLDVDARVVADPNPYFREQCRDCDVAVHFYRDVELISATILLNPTNMRMHLLEKWMEVNAMRPDTWDQKNLQTAIDATPGLRVHRLPPEYNWIEDGRDNQPVSYDAMYPDREPVIVQEQASRRHKQVVGL